MTPARSIRNRATRVVMTTTFLALLTSATALLVYELQSFRTSRVEDLRTQADLVGRASAAALAFDDARVARENLALLGIRPEIEAAAIYTAGGGPFAAFTAPAQAPITTQLAEVPEGVSFDGERLVLRHGIEHEGERLGTIVLRARYDLLGRLGDYLAILAVVTLASMLLASLVARRLQRSVTDPIVAVADVAREVIEQRDYSLRAAKTTDDEVGELVDAFNDMLGELGGQAAALQAADRRKDEFLATLAHELRNPLAPLSTALALLARDERPETRQRVREIMERQLKQMVRLIDDLLEVSRISTGRLELRLEPLELTEVMRSAVESVQPLIDERRHTLVPCWPSAWVNGDRTRLAQVFVNLLTNAARYTDPGGRIEIACEVGERHVEVSVADNGMGIDPSMQAAVFEMFVQVDKSLERGRAGLGVGLALARQLAELHGGSIRLESRGLGHGATFVVRLPRIAAPVVASAAAGAAAPAAAPARRLAILLADDNIDFADSLALMLGDAGHAVTVVHDGRAALAAARAESFDVGLFDIGMPQLNGYELAAALRAEPGTGSLYLIALTGWGQQSDREQARAAGFDRHFVKPVDLVVLLEVLAERARPAGNASP